MTEPSNRRAEADEARKAWEDRIHESRRGGVFVNIPVIAEDAYVDGYLAGDANGYARCLADLERLAIHLRAIVDQSSGIEQDRQSWALNGQLRAVDTLRNHLGWHCTDPTHTCCQQAQREGANE